MKKPTLCVVFGGESSEYEVSLRSAYNVLSLLNTEKYELITVGINKKGEWYLFEGEREKILKDLWQEKGSLPVTMDLSTGQLLVLDRQMYAINIDLVLPIMHGEYAEDGRLLGLLDMAHLKYVGNGPFASYTCMDKAITKSVAEGLKIPVAKSLLVRKNRGGGVYKNTHPYILRGSACGFDTVMRELGAMGLSLPLFVKPAMCGSSVGAQLVKEEGALFGAVDFALKYSDTALIEEYIRGDEVEVGVIQKGDEIIASTSGTIKHKGEFYDYDTKYIKEGTEYVIPSQIEEKTEKYLRECAKKLFLQLGCRGLCRFDFFVCGDRVVFNEANTMPGFTDISMFCMLFEKSGIDKKSLVDALVDIRFDKNY